MLNSNYQNLSKKIKPLRKLFVLCIKHKIFTAVLAVVIVGGGYYFYSSAQSQDAGSTYTLGTAAKGTIVLAVTGTGQVAVTNQVDLKPKGSGTIEYDAHNCY